MTTDDHTGSDFDDFLAEEGMLTEVRAAAIQRVLSHQLAQEMQRTGMTKAELAARMGTSRSAVDRLLDAENASVTLRTLERAAAVLGRRVHLELV